MFAQPSQPAPSNYHQMPYPPPAQASRYPGHHLPPPVRQLHAPKSPLYRPAVLRPTEHPPRPPSATTPSTSPKSFHSSLSGDSKQEQFVARNPTVYNINTPEEDEEDDTFDVTKIVESEDGEEGGRMTGPPTRSHWKADHESSTCESPKCIAKFNLYTRRHHCRKCGHIFCHQHSTHFLPLNQNAKVHPQGAMSRVCDCCYDNYRKARVAARRSGSVSSASSDSTVGLNIGGAVGGAGLDMKNPAHKRLGAPDSLMGRVGSYVGSVPRDWSWSTF